MRRSNIDRLALLCTLHADGPRTLRRLREVGCHSIEALGEMPTENIGEVLDLPPAAARRLTREATRLHNRLEPELEREEVTYPPAATLRAIGSIGVEIDGEDAGAGAVSRLDVRDRALLERVVQSWHRVDSKLALEPLEAVDLDGSEPGDAVADEPPGASATLRPGVLVGLDEETCRRLARLQILTVEDLVQSSVDELVGGAGLPFTRARTLQFRAGKRRAAEVRPPADSAPFAPQEEELVEDQVQVPRKRFSPRERPLDEPLDDSSIDLTYEVPRPTALDESGPAGPFA